MRRIPLSAAIATAGAALMVVAGLASAAAASTPAAPARHAPPSHPANDPLVAAFEQVSQDTPGTLTKTIPPTWIPAGDDYEQEGLKFYDGRFYISVFDHTDNDGHLIILDSDGNLIKNISFVDGDRTHAGGLSVYGNYAYVPLAVDAPDSSADILRINVKTYQVTNLFTVTYDHVGGVIYDPANHLIVGQDWDSRIFYEWTLKGKIVAKWNNPSDYVAYQDCQYVVYQKMLCSGSSEGETTIGGFDLIDLADPEHAILNGVPNPLGGNAAEILATPVAGGTDLTLYSAASGPIIEYTAFIPALSPATPSPAPSPTSSLVVGSG